MYDYYCQRCNEKFEELVFSHLVSDAEIKCPHCKRMNSKRMVCAPAVSTNGKAKGSQSLCGRPSGFS
ncbi:MAG: hypothetical protein HOA19_07665 [Candidatus Marinimicrobia bacterium]|nr:hypothetical protein [Candidatus Neomarinimicrobiota bacterium]MBT5747802.1 hypothetical protein [Candidatus Neomarinimicrobiota bacterium]MBT6867210.1 hypothetical protein [Candidatus Neomarinimicrobiota bacterium]MBT7041988.1 hypothetical protein [Candidatus Neomarinimicrobiota bacterium]MBT7515131.1 hypothetical protein [Candidatus Neomarinimicrobiota bacterium]